MPKIIVGIISAAFALLIGFACGSLLTKPENSKMEQLINEKKAYQKEISDINSKSEDFKSKYEACQRNFSQLEQRNNELKDDLLNAYKNMEKVKNSSDISEDKNDVTLFPQTGEFK